MALAGVPTWSTTAASNGNSDPTIGMREGMAPSAVNDGIRALMASVAKLLQDLYGTTGGLSTGGASTAYTATTNANYDTSANMNGAIFSIIPHTTSGSNPTLAVDSVSAHPLNVSTGVAIPTGSLISGTPYLVRYKHSTTEFLVIGPTINVLASLDILGGTQTTSPAAGDTLPIYSLGATANRRMLVSDFMTVINALTADASPDSAADYVMTYDASAAAAKKVLLSNFPGRLPPGYINGGIISNNVSNPTTAIDIAAGFWRDSTNTVDMTGPALTAKDLTSVWVAGGSAGIRATGAIANTTYHIWAGRTAASATADYYAHTSAVAATALAAWQAETGGSSYAYVRLIGSIIRSGGNILAFTQYGDEFLLTTPALDVSNGSPGILANTGTLTVPVGIKVNATVNFTVPTGGDLYISSLDTADLAASQSATPLAQGGASGSSVIMGNTRVWTSTSATIRYRSDLNNTVKITTLGWKHPRGKDI